MKVQVGASFIFDRFGRAITVSLLLFMAAFNASAWAQDGPGPKAAAAAKEAADKMQAYLRDLEKLGGQPDYSKPPASEYFKAVFNEDALVALPEPKIEDLIWLAEWQNNASETAVAMHRFGAKSLSKLELIKASARNLRENEAVMAGLVPAIHDFVKT